MSVGCGLIWRLDWRGIAPEVIHVGGIVNLPWPRTEAPTVLRAARPSPCAPTHALPLPGNSLPQSQPCGEASAFREDPVLLLRAFIGLKQALPETSPFDYSTFLTWDLNNV